MGKKITEKIKNKIMPYKVKGQCVYKKEGGAKVGCTKGDVKDYLAALHANVDDVNESNKLKGGKADKLTPEDIAKKFKVTTSKIQAQIRKGLKVEMEHTKDREKAISFDDAHELIDGKLVLNKKVSKTERTNGISDEDMLKLSRYIGSISKKLFGNYNPENKSIAQRTLLGHLLFQMRGWLVPGIERRYKGISKVNIRSEDLDLAQMNYNKETEQFEEGTYTSAVRFIFSVSKDVKKLKIQAIPENWNKLTDYEESNINKSLVGLGITVGVLAIFLSLKEGLKLTYDYYE